jgi:hypothetical protein
MSAILHCIVTDIENSRMKDQLRAWKENTDACPLIKQIRMLKEEFLDVCEQLSEIYRYNPHIKEQHYSDSEWDIYRSDSDEDEEEEDEEEDEEEEDEET